MEPWKDNWSTWLLESYYVNYTKSNGVRYYEQVIAKDITHYEYGWGWTAGNPVSVPINPLSESGPFIPDDIYITEGYDKNTNTNQIWQVIFGIKGQVYIYIELPTDIHRHGLPKRVKPFAGLREVGHFEEWMSPFQEPSFITEHYMMFPEYDRMGIDAYNPQDRAITPRLNFIISKMITERIGTEQAGVLKPSRERYREILDKLYKKVVNSKAITLYPVRAPAEPVGGD